MQLTIITIIVKLANSLSKLFLLNKEKIKSLFKELGFKVDQANRFEQNCYYIEKYDFSEEIDRLDSHLNLFKLTLNDNSNNF